MNSKENPAIIHETAKNLYRIDLNPDIEGFHTFITAWVHAAPPVCLIDAGPSATGPVLVEALAELGIDHLDGILLTHIHMDHAGGAGHVARAYPKTPVYCHPKAMDHIEDPERLYQGTVKVLKNVGRAYGPMLPVPRVQLRDAFNTLPDSVTALATPGHAVHHISFRIHDLWFIGETAGVCLPLPDGTRMVRPATPPVFIYQVFRDSLKSLMDLNPRWLCYGHLGMAGAEERTLERHLAQLDRWQSFLAPHRSTSAEEAEDKAADLLNQLRDIDPELCNLDQLTAESRGREIYFMKNSIRGFLTQKIEA